MTNKKPDQSIAIATEHFKAGRLAEAEQIYRAILQAEPDHVLANHNLGLLALRVGRGQMAVELISKAIARNSSTSAIHVNLGEALRSLGRLDEAMAAYNKAIEINPNDGYAFGNLGGILMSLGRIVDAEACLRKAIGIRPDNFEARMALAQILESDYRAEEAIKQLGAAAKFSHMPGFQISKLGKIYARLGENVLARKYLKKSLERDPSDSDGALLVLAALGDEAAPARAPAAQMKKLYAERAATWDDSVQAANGYRGMDLVADTLRGIATGKVVILDAGCGTGLVGELVRDLAELMEGIDLSSPMLAKALAKNCYDALFAGDLLEYMRANVRKYDAITSAATLIHFGDLHEVFVAAALALKPSGHFIFTVFPNENPDIFSVGSLHGMAEGGCFFHGRNYIAQVALETGFEVVKLEAAVHEYRDDAPIYGLIVALRASASAT
ncbi:MAG TPA: tetratricopeptide repeat protein [Burkholderiaceae bacterium]|jgi:predicted TPR repeat methyltransferase